MSPFNLPRHSTSPCPAPEHSWSVFGPFQGKSGPAGLNLPTKPVARNLPNRPRIQNRLYVQNTRKQYWTSSSSFHGVIICDRFKHCVSQTKRCKLLQTGRPVLLSNAKAKRLPSRNRIENHGHDRSQCLRSSLAVAGRA